jgi:hypothetical protein
MRKMADFLVTAQISVSDHFNANNARFLWQKLAIQKGNAIPADYVAGLTERSRFHHTRRLRMSDFLRAADGTLLCRRMSSLGILTRMFGFFVLIKISNLCQN